MNDIDSTPLPQGDLALQTIAMPKDTNANGDIFGGWLLSQMDLAGGIAGGEAAGGRVATVAIDGMSREAASVIVAKASHYGGNYVCAAEARLEDPVFQVCLFTRPGPLNTLRYALALRRGALHRLADVQVVIGREVAITEPAGEPLQLDGDPAGVLPAEVTIAPAALSLICPVA
jgi:acyl-coenzyme A thioesterase PaaI-like protein